MDRYIFFAQVVSELELALEEHNHAFRFPTMATLSPANEIYQRVVVLRSFNSDVHEMRIYTDTRSQKWIHLQQNPSAHLCFYDPKTQLQIRAKVHCKVIKDDPTQVDLFNTFTEEQRVNYQTRLAPGAEIASKEVQHGQNAYFGVINAYVQKYDILQLAGKKTKRLLIKNPGRKESLSWLVP